MHVTQPATIAEQLHAIRVKKNEFNQDIDRESEVPIDRLITDVEANLEILQEYGSCPFVRKPLPGSHLNLPKQMKASPLPIEATEAINRMFTQGKAQTEIAYSERCRSAFRSDADRDSKLMPITIPK